MIFGYNFFIQFYGAVIKVFSLFNAKAKKWIAGRRNWQTGYASLLKPDEQRIWIHCSSLGEFEQGRNLIEAMKSVYPGYKIVLTFFSPSGYEIRKNYEYADYVFYLPADTKSNAAAFIDLIKPSLAVFVKYEFWYHYLHTLHQKKIPAVIISAAFREEQIFFKWYGGFFRKMLGFFNIIFVQDEKSKSLLQTIGTENTIVSGDTRYDRVLTISAGAKKLPLIEKFVAGEPVIIAGSTWKEDENLLKNQLPYLPDNFKVIIAPHEIDTVRLGEVKKAFPEAVFYSDLQKNANPISQNKVLIIDNIGMLSSLYSYAKIAFVGGGFQKGGIHNILEPAVFGAPVIFGPVYKKFVEANELVKLQYCFSVADNAGCKAIFSTLINDESAYQTIHQGLKTFMLQKSGATNSIIAEIDKRQWL